MNSSPSPIARGRAPRFWSSDDDDSQPIGPPPETFFILAENGDAIVTEGSDNLVTELAP